MNMNNEYAIIIKDGIYYADYNYNTCEISLCTITRNNANEISFDNRCVKIIYNDIIYRQIDKISNLCRSYIEKYNISLLLYDYDRCQVMRKVIDLFDEVRDYNTLQPPKRYNTTAIVIKRIDKERVKLSNGRTITQSKENYQCSISLRNILITKESDYKVNFGKTISEDIIEFSKGCYNVNDKVEDLLSVINNYRKDIPYPIIIVVKQMYYVVNKNLLGNLPVISCYDNYILKNEFVEDLFVQNNKV